MIRLFLALLRILFPLDVVARMSELTRWFVAELHAVSQDPRKLADLANIPEARAWFEGRIAFTEEAVQLLIHERARQILGLPYIYTRRNRDGPPHCARPLPEVLKRLERLVVLHANIERLAHRRAARMRREMEACPLRLGASHQSTSPTLRVVEDSVRLLEVLPRRRRGRWIATSSSRDGGGCVSSRGPPLFLNSRKHFARALQDNLRGRSLMPENEKAALADGLPESS